MSRLDIAGELVKLANIIVGDDGTLFSVDDVEDVVKRLKKEINAPEVYVDYSTLGGKERVSIIIKISLDKKSEWANNIFHNSRFFMLHFYRDGTLEQFTMAHTIGKKLRLSRNKSVDDVIKRINKYIDIVN